MQVRRKVDTGEELHGSGDDVDAQGAEAGGEAVVLGEPRLAEAQAQQAAGHSPWKTADACRWRITLPVLRAEYTNLSKKLGFSNKGFGVWIRFFPSAENTNRLETGIRLPTATAWQHRTGHSRETDIDSSQ